jgi:hypothetical protein
LGSLRQGGQYVSPLQVLVKYSFNFVQRARERENHDVVTGLDDSVTINEHALSVSHKTGNSHALRQM